VELAYTTDTGPIANSAGEGGIDRVPGNVDFTGSIMAFGYKPPSYAFPNQDFSLAFTENGTNLVSCSAVKCTGLEIMVPAHDKTGRNAIFYVVHFGADGIDLSRASMGGPSPSNTLTKYVSKGLAPYLSSGTSMARQMYTQWQHLMFMADVERKVNSDTSGVYFRAAGNLDWRFTYNQEVNSMALLPAINQINAIAMQTNPSYAGGTSNGAGSSGYWFLEYGICTKVQGKVDHASRLPTSYDVTFEKTTNGTSSSYVADPDGNQVWPSYSSSD
jgi:hypothetical protein